jgi:ADP-ribose pyrophosphatase
LFLNARECRTFITNPSPTKPEMEKTLTSKLLHKGRHFNFKTDEIQLSSGKTTTRDIVDHPGAVAIVPILDDGRILLVKQYRYTTGKELLEIPAGTLEKGEAPDNCARRELKEETGYTAGSMKKILAMYMAPGYSNEVIHLYFATALKAGESHAEEDEDISLEVYSADELLDGIEKNTIEDAKTIVGVLIYLTRG